ncbi:MAG: hypothetical protein Q8O67_08375 [Deltaproteobacteria bacterium]|nr:hypothetical protein [Deltaproteobacteria bacterium]
MFLPLVLSSVLAAPPLAGGEVSRVLVLDLRAEGVDPATARLVRDEITAGLAQSKGLEVLSTEDLRRMVSMEAEKEAAGCTDESCLAEIGAAMGARFIVHGSVGLIGDTTLVQVSLFDTSANRAIARETADAANANELLPSLRAAVRRLRVSIGGETEPLAWQLPVGGSALAVGAITLLIGGTITAVQASIAGDVTPPGSGGPAPDDRLQAQETGRTALVFAVVGGVVSAAGGGILGWGLAQ